MGAAETAWRFVVQRRVRSLVIVHKSAEWIVSLQFRRGSTSPLSCERISVNKRAPRSFARVGLVGLRQSAPYAPFG